MTSRKEINIHVPFLGLEVGGEYRQPFADPEAIIILKNQKRVPPNYKKITILTENGVQNLIWRYMTTDDLTRYANRWTAYNRLILGENYIDPDPKWIDHPSRLYRELAKSYWPNDFIVILGQLKPDGALVFEECSPIDFYFYPRELLLDVAVIENVSSRKIAIDALIGNASEDRSLRPQETSKALRENAPGVEIGGLGALASGEKLVVPIRMTFVVPNQLEKAVEGFDGSLPKMTNYVWGPEIAITGIKVNGEAAMLETSAANYLALVTSSGEGSCPYLYVWNDDAQRWRNQGKIIHKAAGPANEMAEVREFDGLVSRFQIIEQEAELAFINSAALELEFVDGSLKTVPLNHQFAKDTDNLYQELYFGNVLELAFNLPSDIDPAKVKRSRLKVTGYYRRYGDILSERMIGPNKKDAPILRAVQR